MKMLILQETFGRGNVSKRTGVVYLMALIVCVLPCRVTWAEDLLKGGEYSFDASIGYNYANVDGYRGKVGEYEYLHSSVEGSFDLQGITKNSTWIFGGSIRIKMISSISSI